MERVTANGNLSAADFCAMLLGQLLFRSMGHLRFCIKNLGAFRVLLYSAKTKLYKFRNVSSGNNDVRGLGNNYARIL